MFNSLRAKSLPKISRKFPQKNFQANLAKQPKRGQLTTTRDVDLAGLGRLGRGTLASVTPTVTATPINVGAGGLGALGGLGGLDLTDLVSPDLLGGTLTEDFDTNNIGNTYIPFFDIFQAKDAYIIEAQIPGIPKEDVRVDVDETTVTISGQRRESEEDKDLDWWAKATKYGSFTRSFLLPPNTNPAEMKANLKDGILKLTIPKGIRPNSQNITIDG